MRRTTLILFSAASASGSLPAQSVKVTPSTLVAVSPPDHPITEPHLAIDPTRPERLVGAVYQASKPGLRFPAGQDEQTCAAFVSGDSGATWTKHEFNTTWCADPWVAITPDGQALVTMLGRHAAFPQQGNSGLVAFHSADAGRTWDTLVVGMGRSHDHPTMAVDLGSGPRRGWIYLSSHRGRSAEDGRVRYGVYLARSRTGGKSFDDPAYVVPNNLHNLTEIPAVLSDGTLIASFVDAAAFSTDTATGQQRETLFERRRAWVVRSTDGGYTFSSPLFVTDACGPPPGYRLSAFAADASSGQYAGRLYFACRAAGGGPIVVTSSRDRGETWSAPVRMQATLRDSATTPIPALAVNDRGAVLVAWWGRVGRRKRCVRHKSLRIGIDRRRKDLLVANPRRDVRGRRRLLRARWRARRTLSAAVAGDAQRRATAQNDARRGHTAESLSSTSRSASCSCRARRAAWRCRFRSPRFC